MSANIIITAREEFGFIFEDISDYVIADAEFNLSVRERDYSLVTTGVKIVLTYHYPKDVNDIDLINLFLDDGVDSYTATYKVMKVIPIVDQQVYELECDGVLARLKDYKLTYNNLHNILVGGTTSKQNYDSHDFWGFPNVAIWYAVDRMLSVAGFTLDIGSSQKEQVYLKDKAISWDGIVLTSGVDVKLKQIKIDENMFYSLNQDEAGTPISPYFDEYDPDKEITFFSFISWFSSKFSLAWRQTTALGFTFDLDLLADYERPIPGDENFFSKDEPFAKQKENVDWQILAENDRSKYEGAVGSALKDTYYEPTTDPNEKWYNSLLFLIADPSDETKPAPLGRYLIDTIDIKNYITPEDIIDGSFNVGDRVKQSEASDYSKETINTIAFGKKENTLNQTFLLNFINLQTKIERIL